MTDAARSICARRPILMRLELRMEEKEAVELINQVKKPKNKRVVSDRIRSLTIFKRKASMRPESRERRAQNSQHQMFSTKEVQARRMTRIMELKKTESLSKIRTSQDQRRKARRVRIYTKKMRKPHQVERTRWMMMNPRPDFSSKTSSIESTPEHL